MFESGEGFDWATAEALAFGSLLAEGYGVRLSGQDSGRGTFSQRHAVWVDQTDGAQIHPADHDRRRPLRGARQPACPNSACSASNMAIRSPTRRRWCCGRRSSAISPTARRSSSTSSSPPAKPSGCAPTASSCCCRTAIEGQGPEHSSARLERYLQLCAEDNMQVANCTTPANYFHILRRQMRRDFRKPLVMMTPKSLLRHKLAVSSLADFTGDSHFRRILSRPQRRRPTARRRAAGPVLGQARLRADGGARRGRRPRRRRSSASSSSIRSRRSRWSSACRRMTKLEEVVWAQEEPKNNGAWFFVEPLLEQCLADAGMPGMRPLYAGRDASASTATGLAKRHAAEQAALIAEALGTSKAGRSADRRSARRNEGKTMATDVKVPALGELITEATLGAVAEEARRGGEGRRADRQPRDRQGRGRGALAGRRRDGRAAGQGRRHGRRRRGDRADRERGGGAAPRRSRRRSRAAGRRRPNPAGAGETPRDAVIEHAPDARCRRARPAATTT